MVILAGEQCSVTETAANSYLCGKIYRRILLMFKKIRELYKDFRPYVRVDLIMYGVMILLIILYFVLSLFL